MEEIIKELLKNNELLFNRVAESDPMDFKLNELVLSQLEITRRLLLILHPLLKDKYSFDIENIDLENLVVSK